MKKILVVDDDDSVRRLVTATLAGGDFAVLQASDGDEALKIARVARPALVVLDVAMPGVDGVEVCRRIKSDRRSRGTVVVMLTAKTQDRVRDEALAAGADFFLTKPFSPLELLDIVGTDCPK